MLGVGDRVRLSSHVIYDLAGKTNSRITSMLSGKTGEVKTAWVQRTKELIQIKGLKKKKSLVGCEFLYSLVILQINLVFSINCI